MYFLIFLAATSFVNAQSNLPVHLDPRCKKMDRKQWDGFSQKEVIRKRAFSQLNLPHDREYTEVLFGHETKTQLNNNWFCVEGWNTIFEPAKQLECRVTNINLLDKSNKAPGVVTLDVRSGTTSRVSVVETNASETAGGVMVEMTGEIPLVGKATTTVTIQKRYTRTWGKEQVFETNTLTIVSRAIKIDDAKSQCTASLTTTSCTHETKGRYPIVALGWVGWRLKDEHTHNGARARRWYVFIDNFPRKDREDWGRINAGISSDTYATAISQCESPKRSLFGRRHSEELSPDHMVRDLTETLRSSIPDHADELQTRESKLERAKEALPDNLKAKVMEIGGDLYLPMDDDE